MSEILNPSNQKKETTPLVDEKKQPSSGNFSREPVTIDQDRVEKLHKLLGADYDYAKDKGLLDIFAYDPSSGEDGVLHVLTGVTKKVPNGGEVVEGFHHESSPELVLDEGEMLQTYVTGPVRATTPSKRRSKYQRTPFAPYRSNVVIDGRPKVETTEENQGDELKFLDNMMYPKEYDPLAVLQTIKWAYDRMDPANDVVSEENGLVVNVVEAPLIDGVDEDGAPKSPLVIRLVMDENKKIISAIPLSSKNVLKIDDAELEQHLGL